MNLFSEGGISQKDIGSFQAAYEANPYARIMTNALHRVNLSDLALNSEEMQNQNFMFSIDIKTMPSTHQYSSGRCWLFAATNCLREIIAKQKNLEDFELSQAWLAFWDKFERANYYLESILATADRPLEDRVVDFIIRTGVGDGGQWDMFVNIINKYGICPKAAFSDNAQSKGTSMLNHLLNRNLKHNAVILRKMVASGASKDAIKAAKQEMLSKIYTFLTTCYGNPPKTFSFEGRDKDDNYFREENYTPLSFKEKYFGNMLDNYVSIINAPTDDKPFNRMFTVDFLGNVADGKPVSYLNLPIEEMKALVLKQLKDGEIVWFGSDCGKFRDPGEKRLWSPEIFEYEAVTGLDLSLSKGEMLDYDYSAMNHAMVITGVNLVDDKPTRWKIENSWGRDDPNKGYYFMSDSWFDSFVFQAVVNKKYLGDKIELLKQEPIVLKPWDPMGTLA